MKKFFILFLITFQFYSFSLLSPTAQSAVEVQRIFFSKEALEAFGDPSNIISCEKTETGYKIKSEDFQMDVKVIYEPSKKIGPKLFHLEFGPKEKLE